MNYIRFDGMYQCSPKYLSSVCVKFSFFLLLLLTIVFSSNSNAQVGIGFTDDGTYTGTIGSNKGALEAYRCPAGTVLRGGSVCLNSFGRFVKWISAAIMPPPS
ncbi:hypothetical protein FHY56_10030, partial [Brucella gallinifaecis]